MVSTRVDELEKLGQAFGVEAWELLRPHGHATLSPLALLLAAHLDRSAPDESHAYTAALAVIDALTTTPGSPSKTEPAREPSAAPLPGKEKRAG